ncbi:hypothetical protein L1887_45173 [Cichorium endivia]|nr:hypothetical protein L1887_45173 [Cichorium endivia]
MAEQDGGVAGPHAAGRFDKGLLFQHQRVAAHQTGKRRYRKDRNRNDNVRHAAAHDRHHGNREQNAGKSKQHVADAHDDAVPPAFVISGNEAQHGTDGRADQHREHPGGKRDLRPDQHAAKDIAPEGVHAEPVQHRRSVVQTVVVKIVFRIKRRHPRRNHRHRNQQQHKQSRGHRDRLAAKRRQNSDHGVRTWSGFSPGMAFKTA